MVCKIAHSIHDNGGRALLVGGVPRDIVFDIIKQRVNAFDEGNIKDLDIEVHGLSLEQTEQLLSRHGIVSTIGKSFGVLRLYGLPIDWSLPRIDDVGRKPQVHIDSGMALRDAFMRRDLTMNAMGIDLITYEFIDVFGGMQDMRDGILRVPDERLFVQDPLRFYRVMHFVGRFEMKPDAVLKRLCEVMDISMVAIERIEQEFEKLLFRSRRPSLGIRWLRECARLNDVIPEIAVLIGVPQSPRWHPEGDVFEHSMQALDASARFVYRSSQEQLVCMYASFCHDVGKALTTRYIDGAYKSIGHDRVGARLIPRLLSRITVKKSIIMAVKALVKYHMIPTQLVNSNAKPGSYKRLALKMTSQATLRMLALVCLADKQGRNGAGHEPLCDTSDEITCFMERAEQAQVSCTVEKPILYGRDIIDIVSPGPVMGALLRYAYEVQVDEGITDREILKNRVRAQLKEWHE